MWLPISYVSFVSFVLHTTCSCNTWCYSYVQVQAYVHVQATGVQANLHDRRTCTQYRAGRIASPIDPHQECFRGAAFGTGTDVHVEALVDDEDQRQAEDTEDDDQLAHTTDPHKYNVEHEG